MPVVDADLSKSDRQSQPFAPLLVTADAFVGEPVMIFKRRVDIHDADGELGEAIRVVTAHVLHPGGSDQ